ncbi:MAG: hypothetical protein JSW61_15045 [Candidatus Thorarchaeota archaeon]|nr:MAG: hypothetical protein JSW61_15045 [Candidatus Thorarchaeota archaeon]
MCAALNNNWNIENYFIVDSRVLTVEVSIPLVQFLYIKIDDMKEAWVGVLREFVTVQPGLDVSWTMEPRSDDALVTIRIAKTGELEEFTPDEAHGAITAVDSLFD